MLPARSYLLQKLGLINLHWLSHRYLHHAGIKAAAQRDKPTAVSPASCRAHTLRVACVGILRTDTSDQGWPPRQELLPPTLTASAASVCRVTAVSICAVPTHQLLEAHKEHTNTSSTLADMPEARGCAFTHSFRTKPATARA